MKKAKLVTFKDTEVDPVTATCFGRLLWRYTQEFDSAWHEPPKINLRLRWRSVVRLLIPIVGFNSAGLLSIAKTGGFLVKPEFMENYLDDWQTIAAWEHCVEKLGWKIE